MIGKNCVDYKNTCKRRLFDKKEGTFLLVVNSVCGCAAANARPGVKISLQNEKKPEGRRTR